MSRTNVTYVLIRKKQRYKMEALAMALPILPGKTEDWKQLCQEMPGPRPREEEASGRCLGITREAAYPQHILQGDLSIIYLEAGDIQRRLQERGTSQGTSGQWFPGS
jgi:hypothetical protein